MDGYCSLGKWTCTINESLYSIIASLSCEDAVIGISYSKKAELLCVDYSIANPNGLNVVVKYRDTHNLLVSRRFYSLLLELYKSDNLNSHSILRVLARMTNKNHIADITTADNIVTINSTFSHVIKFDKIDICLNDILVVADTYSYEISAIKHNMIFDVYDITKLINSILYYSQC